MNIKKPTKAELMAWVKDNSLDHGTYVFIPASKVADMSDLPDPTATSIGDLLKEWANKPVTPADYVFDPTMTLADHWRRFALDYRNDRNKLREENEKLKEKHTQEFVAASKVRVENLTLNKHITEHAYRIADMKRVINEKTEGYSRLQKQVDESGASYRRTIDRAQTVINEKTDLIARLRGCLDKERDAYARLAKRVERMRVKFPMLMESIDSAMDDEEAGE
jgi:hypothetical protein